MVPLAFENLTAYPIQPASGQGFVVKAGVRGSNLASEYQCEISITQDGAKGGGMIGDSILRRQPDGSYACELPSGYPADLAIVFVVGWDGTTWVRSAILTVKYAGGPGGSAPASPIGDFRLDDQRRATVTLQQPPLDNPGVNTNAFVNSWAFSAPRKSSARGVLLNETSLGQFGGQVVDPGSVVVVAYAFTENALGGFDHTAFLSKAFGDCAVAACLRESG
jgi:hypothetical protein